MRVSAADVRERSGDLVRAARVSRGLSVRQLAGLIHVSPATITALEQGRTSITIERLVALAESLEVSTATLIGTPAPPTPEPELDWREFATPQRDPALTGAARAFMSTGYHGATIRSIAHAAGISPAGIYHHYASKHDLLRELMLRGMADLSWRVEAAAADSDEPIERLAHVVEAIALWHARRVDSALIGASEMRSLDASAHREVVLRRRRVQDILDEAIVGALPPGYDRRDGLDAARAISAMCTAIPRWFKPEGPNSAEHVALQYADFALRLIGRAGRGRLAE